MSAPAHPLLTALAASPGPHPPLAQLRAYVAGTLSGPAAHRIEEHTLACARCADVLEGLELTDAPTTDRALTDLQQRLRQRVNELTEQPSVVAPNRFRPRTWPRLAAAAALAAGLGAGLWGWQHRPAAELKSAEVAVLSAPAPTPPPAPGAPAASRAAEVPAPASAATPAASSAVATASAPPARAIRPARARPAPPTVALGSTPMPPRAGYAAATASAEEAKAPSSALNSAAPADSAAHGTDLARRQATRDTTSLADVAYLSANQATLRKARATDTKTARRVAGRLAPASQAAAAVLPAAPPVQEKSVQKEVASKEVAAAAVAPAGVPASASPTEAASAPRTRVALPPPPTLEPAPVGGYRALRTYLRKQAEAFEPDGSLGPVKGLVRVRFTVSAAGKPELEQAKMLRSLRADYDAEVLRMLAEGPAWVPGVAGGRRAPLPVQVEVLF